MNTQNNKAYEKLLEVSPKAPIKNAYESRLAKFQEENDPQKRAQATGWHNTLPDLEVQL